MPNRSISRLNQYDIFRYGTICLLSISSVTTIYMTQIARTIRTTLSITVPTDCPSRLHGRLNVGATYWICTVDMPVWTLEFRGVTLFLNPRRHIIPRTSLRWTKIMIKTNLSHFAGIEKLDRLCGGIRS